MDELIMSGELLESKESSPFLVAAVADVTADGITISIHGGLETLKKKYSSIQTGYQLSAGDRVLVAKVSGTYVILGKIAI